jgi:hypothetical protein
MVMMTNDISEADARLALNAIEQRRLQVVEEIDMPGWYWWGLACAWIALGVVTDLANPWIATAAMLVFGAAHSAVAQHVLSGRHRSRQLSVHRDMVSEHVPALLFGCLVVLALVTIGLGFAANADGAEHPATIAGVVVAVAVLCGGPSLMAVIRRRAARRVTG